MESFWVSRVNYMTYLSLQQINNGVRIQRNKKQGPHEPTIPQNLIRKRPKDKQIFVRENGSEACSFERTHDGESH